MAFTKQPRTINQPFVVTPLVDRDEYLCIETDPFDLITTEDDEEIIVGHTNDWTKTNRN